MFLKWDINLLYVVGCLTPAFLLFRVNYEMRPWPGLLRFWRQVRVEIHQMENGDALFFIQATDPFRCRMFLGDGREFTMKAGTCHLIPIRKVWGRERSRLTRAGTPPSI